MRLTVTVINALNVDLPTHKRMMTERDIPLISNVMTAGTGIKT